MFLRRGDEGSVHENLEVIILGVKNSGLLQELSVFAVRIPSNWISARSEQESGTRTMFCNSRWSGTESNHLFKAESRSETDFCRRPTPTSEDGNFCFLVEYCVRCMNGNVVDDEERCSLSSGVLTQGCGRVPGTKRRRISSMAPQGAA